MSESTAVSRLLSSSAFLSITAEQRVRDAFARNGWYAMQGTFYRDTDTAKLREIDVLARQTWLDPVQRVRLALELVVEVKSASEYHLLFSPFITSEEHSRLNLSPSPGHSMSDWVGRGGASRQRLLSIVQRAGLSPADFATFAKAINSATYPNGYASIRRLMIDPPPAELNVGAFRETNVAKERELDSSVLWRAVQGLMSSVRALKRTRRQSRLDILRRLSTPSELDSPPDVKSLLREATDAVAGFDQFHPVVLIDSELWLVEDEKLESVPWCRLIIANSRGVPHFWVDVVNTRGLDEYVDQITRGYQLIFAEAGAELSDADYLF